jgi:hypothetical protein
LGNKHASKTKYIRRRIGKVNTPLNEKLENVEWGKFSYNVLFKLCAVKNMLTKFSLDDDGKVPVYSSESTNNGIIGYTKNEPEFIVNKENPIYIIFGDHTRSFNIATDSFCVTDNVKVLSVKEVCSIKVLLCIISSWKKCIPNIGYSRHWSLAKNIQFNLPISKNGKIDFEFMENFIADLETERIKKLEDYLIANGFDNYTLTAKEKQILKDFKNQKFREFNVIDIFEIENTKNILSRDIIENSGKTPYLCASTENNAISSYISYNEKYLDKGNCVFIGGKTFVVTYQEKDFYSNDSHNLALYFKNNITKLNQLFLVTCINKSLGHKYSWGNSISKAKIQSDKVSLPIKENQPNYELMETLISAIQKLVIKDVVLYVNNKING